MRYLKNLLTVVQLDLKLFLYNKLAIGVLASLVIIFGILTSGLSRELDKVSGIPIGIVDQDQTELSTEVVTKLKTMDGLVVKEAQQVKLEKELESGRIMALFILKEGYESRVKRCQVKNLITLQYLEGSKYASIISDIVAGAMMNQICLYKGIEYYETLEPREGMLGVEEVKRTATQYEGEETNRFRFDLEFRVAEGKEGIDVENAKNIVITRQLYVGILSMLVAIVMLFSVFVLRRTKSMEIREQLTLINRATYEIGHASAILIIAFVLSVGIGVVIYQTFEMKTIHILLMLIAYVWGLFLLNLILFYILSICLKKIASYQFIGLGVTLIMGTLSILAYVGQFLVDFNTEILKFIPNYWFLSRITGIMLEDKEVGKSNFMSILAILVGSYCVLSFIKTKYSER